MKNNQNDKKMDPNDLPQREVFDQKEVYQFPQPADMGKPLESKEEDERDPGLAKDKEAQKTSKEEGLNEAQSAGEAGAFEGFEDQQD